METCISMANSMFKIKMDIDCHVPDLYLTTVNILKGLSHEINFENVDENGQIVALIRAAAGF